MKDKDNRLIAEFMEWSFNEFDFFEYSWDWLMPAVKKCWEVGGKLDYCSALMLADYDFWYVAEGDFEKSYKAVVEFIKTHIQKAIHSGRHRAHSFGCLHGVRDRKRVGRPTDGRTWLCQGRHQHRDSN